MTKANWPECGLALSRIYLDLDNFILSYNGGNARVSQITRLLNLSETGDQRNRESESPGDVMRGCLGMPFFYEDREIRDTTESERKNNIFNPIKKK